MDYIGGKIADTTELIRGKLTSLTKKIDTVDLNLFTRQEMRNADKRVYYRIESSKFQTDPMTASFIEKYRQSLALKRKRNQTRVIQPVLEIRNFNLSD